jgi:cellulose synthase/poly-beta-1,6-N-acetylglucosamine synthase-like glycosyltransferase
MFLLTMRFQGIIFVLRGRRNGEGTIMLGLAVFLILIPTAYYAVCGLYFRRGFSNLGPVRGVTEPLSCTVVVAARNEEKNLPSLLACLERQTLVPEMILVDDRSEDGTARCMQRFAESHSNVFVLRIAPEERTASPKKHAIAKAMERASGEIVLTTDADAQPGPKWVAEMAGRFDKDTGMVLGYAPYRTDGPYGSVRHRLLALEYFAMAAVTAGTAGMGRPTTCNGANLAFRTRVFREIGGYGGTDRWLSGDDDLLMQRIRTKTRWKVRFAGTPEAAVFNNPPLTLRDLVRQRIRFCSKHLAYPLKMKLALSGIYLFYASLLVSTVAVLFKPALVPAVAFAWLVKTAVELAFLKPFRRMIEPRPLLRWYPLLVPFHLVYVVVFPLLGQIVKPRWK